MKRTDIAMIIFIASISVLVAYFVTKGILGDGKNTAVKVKTIDPISKTVATPDTKVFQNDAINPTVEVFIGEGQQASQ